MELRILIIETIGSKDWKEVKDYFSSKKGVALYRTSSVTEAYKI